MNRGTFLQRDPIAAELSSFDYMDYWMNSIHAHSAKNTRDSVDNTTLSPPIFIVGTHRNSLHDAPELQAKLVRTVIPLLYGQCIRPSAFEGREIFLIADTLTPTE